MWAAAPGTYSCTPLVAPEPLSFSCPVLPEPQAGALPHPGPGALPRFLCLGRRAQALAIAGFAVFPSAWPFSDLDVCLLGPLPLVSLEKSCLLSSPLPGALFQGLRRSPGLALLHFWSHAGSPLSSFPSTPSGNSSFSSVRGTGCGPAFTCQISSIKGTIGLVKRKGHTEIYHWLFYNQQMLWVPGGGRELKVL